MLQATKYIQPVTITPIDNNLLCTTLTVTKADSKLLKVGTNFQKIQIIHVHYDMAYTFYMHYYFLLLFTHNFLHIEGYIVPSQIFS